MIICDRCGVTVTEKAGKNMKLGAGLYINKDRRDEWFLWGGDAKSGDLCTACLAEYDAYRKRNQLALTELAKKMFDEFMLNGDARALRGIRVVEESKERDAANALADKPGADEPFADF